MAHDAPPTGSEVGDLAPDFELLDQDGNKFLLREATKRAPTLLVFYPGDFTPVCTKQLCDYRNRWEDFRTLGLQVVGISKDTLDQHERFAAEYRFPFPLLSDPGNQIAKLYGCNSIFMFGTVSRAQFILDTKRVIRYRKVEATAITRRTSDELLETAQSLRSLELI